MYHIEVISTTEIITRHVLWLLFQVTKALVFLIDERQALPNDHLQAVRILCGGADGCAILRRTLLGLSTSSVVNATATGAVPLPPSVPATSDNEVDVPASDQSTIDSASAEREGDCIPAHSPDIGSDTGVGVPVLLPPASLWQVAVLVMAALDSAHQRGVTNWVVPRDLLVLSLSFASDRTEFAAWLLQRASMVSAGGADDLGKDLSTDMNFEYFDEEDEEDEEEGDEEDDEEEEEDEEEEDEEGQQRDVVVDGEQREDGRKKMQALLDDTFNAGDKDVATRDVLEEGTDEKGASPKTLVRRNSHTRRGKRRLREMDKLARAAWEAGARAGRDFTCETSLKTRQSGGTYFFVHSMIRNHPAWKKPYLWVFHRM